MKALKKLFILSLMAACTAVFFSCGTNDTVTSSLSSDHMTVQQIKSGVKIVIKKEASEDINIVKVVDVDGGTTATVDLGTKLTESFIWPFAEKGKEYTLCAKLIGKKSYAEEFVTFTVENECASAVAYSQAYNDSKLILIADGPERRVMLESSKKTLKDVFGASKVKNANLVIDVYPGKKADDLRVDPIATLNKPLDEKTDLQEIFDGYDLIANAGLFKLTPAEMNKRLSAKPVYHARATVLFTLDGKYPKDVQFSTQSIDSNDTIYTPIAAEDLPQDAK